MYTTYIHYKSEFLFFIFFFLLVSSLLYPPYPSYESKTPPESIVPRIEAKDASITSFLIFFC